jgi:hypothetical protein
MLFRAIVVSLALFASACSLARGTLASDGSSGELDAGGGDIDAGPPPDAHRPDTGVPEDAWIVDAATLDDAYVEAPDAYVEPPDAYVEPPDAYVRPTCTAAYGGVTNFVLCSADDADECIFYGRLSGSSCGAFCGAACVRAFENGGPADRCAAGGEFTCTQTTTDELCVCARPP